MKRKALPDEIDFLESLCQKVKDMPDSETVAARLEYLMKWYDGKASGNKRKYNRLRFLSYFLPCCVTLVNVYTFIFCNIHSFHHIPFQLDNMFL